MFFSAIVVVQVQLRSLDNGACIGHVSRSLRAGYQRKTAIVTQITGEYPQLGTPTLHSQHAEIGIFDPKIGT